MARKVRKKRTPAQAAAAAAAHAAAAAGQAAAAAAAATAHPDPRPATSSPNAILGGDEVKKAHKQAQKTHRQARKVRARAAKAYEQQGNALDRELARQAKASTPDVATGQDPKTYKPISEEDAQKQREENLGTFIDAQIKARDPGAIHETLGKIGSAAHTGAEIASILPIGPGGDAKLGIKGILAGAKALGIKGAEHEGEKVVAKATAKTVAKDAEKTATKAQAKLDKAIAKGNSTRAEKLKAAAKRKKPAIASKTGRQVARRKRATAVNQAAITAAPVVGGIGAGIASSTGQALYDDPKKTIETTLRSVPGLVTAPLGIAADTYETGKNLVTGKDDPLAPLRGQLKQQERYVKGLGDIAAGGDRAQRLIENDYGLIPALSVAGGIYGLSRHGKVAAEPREPLRVRRLRKQAADETNTERAMKAEAKLVKAERGTDKRKNRRRVAQVLDTAGRRTDAQVHEDLRTKGIHDGKSRTMEKSLRKLQKIPISAKRSVADAIALIHSEGIPLDSAKGKERLIEIRDRLTDPPESHTPSRHAATTRQVLDALIENPHHLENPDLARIGDALGQIGSDISSRDHEARVGVEQATGRPDPLQDRARLLPIARQEGIHLPEERHPQELRHIEDLPKPAPYKNMRRAIREQASRKLSRAKALETQAVALRKLDPAKAAELEGKAAKMRADAEERLAVTNRLRNAKAMESKARDLRKAGDAEGAQKLKEEAQALRQEHFAAETGMLDEYRSEVGSAIEKQGLREPIFFPESSAADIGGVSGGGRKVATSQLAGAPKMRSGKLREMGLVDQSGKNMIEGIYRRRANQEMNRAMRDLMDEFSDGKLVTGEQARRMLENGEAPAGHGLIPLQEFKRAYKAGEWEHAQGLVENAIQEGLHDAQFEKGKKYAWISHSMLQETYDQMKPLGKWAKNLKRFGGAQSIALLGTSPTWVAYQSIATPILLLARHPNPATWVRAAKTLVTDYRKIPVRVRKDFEAQFGGTVSDTATVHNAELGMTPKNVRSMHNAARVATTTFPGKLLNSIKTGGPLIKGVAKYEGRLRTLEALMEMDKLHNRMQPRKFLLSLSRLDTTTRKHISHVDGLSRKQQIEFYAKHPEQAKVLSDQINDAIGDWTSMTNFEKNAGAIAIFYPFLRFSLRWTFHSFPKNNPIKATILGNLAQSNSQEVERMLNGPPSFFSGYGSVPVHSGPGGTPEVALNVARIAPGSNALIEGLGSGDQINGATVARLLQPILGSVIAQLGFGADPFSGENKASTLQDRGLLFAQQILGLNPITRATLLPKIKPTNPVSELIQGIGGKKSPIEKALLVDPTLSAGVERLKVFAGNLLSLMDKAPSAEEIDAFNQSMIDRGIPVNEHNIRQDPAGQKLLQRAKTADRASDKLKALLKEQGYTDAEVDEAFGTTYGLLNPIGGFDAARAAKRKHRRVRAKAIAEKTATTSSDWGGSSDWDTSSNDWGGSSSDWGGSSTSDWGS